MPLTKRLISFLFAAALSFLVATGACRQEPPAAGSHTTAADPAIKKQSDILIFPNELRVADESINEFVTSAMNVCAAGEYEAFRLLWSVREDPLPRDEFEQGWQAVELIRIRALQQARLILPGAQSDAVAVSADRREGSAATASPLRGNAGVPTAAGEAQHEGETVYLVMAEVSFDPEHPAGKQQANREVVLMLVQERGQWRIANPPKIMRDWLRKQSAETGQLELTQPVTKGHDHDSPPTPGALPP